MVGERGGCGGGGVGCWFEAWLGFGTGLENVRWECAGRVEMGVSCGPAFLHVQRWAFFSPVFRGGPVLPPHLNVVALGGSAGSVLQTSRIGGFCPHFDPGILRSLAPEPEIKGDGIAAERKADGLAPGKP